MKKRVQQTGDHGIGQMVHVVHMSDDVQQLRRFYEDVLGGYVYMGVDEPNYFDREDRYATLLMVGDLCVETMAPRMPADPKLPVGKFYRKFGRHLHSVGYKVEDLAGLADRLLARGVRIAKPGGGSIEELAPDTHYFFPSPRDTAGLMVELCRTDMPGDPRVQETWSSLEGMWRNHPLTLDRFSYVTLGVRDLESAVSVYVDVMQAVPVQTGVDEDLAARYATLQLGDCLLQLAEPSGADSSLGRHVERWGNMIYSLRFRVRDLDSAESWLNKNAVRTTRVRPELFVTEVEDTFGAPMFFSTEDIEGDPFA
ncbi:VOC family protein [Streptomyces sp. NPDC048106]|uniref:VOC family protein n=1 Tax=Streptomyces sp. NPDC048106 TaxID=3155750 RepID=UPI00345586F1